VVVRAQRPVVGKLLKTTYLSDWNYSLYPKNFGSEFLQTFTCCGRIVLHSKKKEILQDLSTLS